MELRETLQPCTHSWIQDPETLELVCNMCGCVQSSETDQDLEHKQSIMQIQFDNTVGPDMAAAGLFSSATTSTECETNLRPNSEGCIIPRKSHVDFSNGGFLSTKIDNRYVDSQGKSLSDRCYTNKLKYNHNTMLSAANPPTLKNSIWRVSVFGDRLNLPHHVQERAAEVFHKAYERKANIHNSINMVCACIYFACKEAGLNKKLGDIATMVADDPKEIKPSKKSIFGCYEKLVFGLDLKVPKHFTIPDDIEYVGSKIGLPQRTIRYALNMYDDVRNKDRIFFSGKSNRLTSIILLYISAMIHNDFFRDDPIELDHFIYVSGAGISQYILQKRAWDYLNHEYFKEHQEKVQKRKIII